MKNLTIRAKLLWGFISVALIAAIIGIYGTLKIIELGKMDTELYVTGTVPLSEIAELNLAVQEIRIIARDLLIKTDAAAQAKLIADEEVQFQIIDKILPSYEKSLRSEKGREIFNDFTKALNELKPQIDRLIIMVQNERIQEGREFFEGDLYKTVNHVKLNLKNMTDAKVQYGLGIANANTASANRSSFVMITLALLGGLLAVALGFIIAKNIKTITNQVLSETNKLVDAAVAGELSVRADINLINKEFQAIPKGFNQTLDAVIGPLTVAATYIENISKGNIPQKIEDKYNGDFNNIKQSLNLCIDSLNGLVWEMNNMSLEHEKGDIDVVVNTDKFQGQFQTMAIGINTMVGAHIAVKKRAMGVFTEFGQGNFEAPMELLPGKKRFINETIEQVRANLKALIADANMLSEAAIAGRLATRADASKHLGDFRKIIEGVNNTLDAVIGPLNVAAGYVDRIAKGDIPSKITDNYNGDFNNIKNNINILIDALLFVTETTKKLSQGDLTMQVELRSENDELLKAISFMVAKLNDVMTQLMEAAENVAAGSNEMSLTASSLAQGANEQAASSEEVSSSVEEMASTIQQNSENAVETEKIATSSAIGIAEVNQASQKSLEAIRLIAEKIRVINDIAEKTDILAINAAIEAARAGEHGKGFAVVAAEVRKLAEVSQKAAIDINTLSSSSLKQTEEAGTQMAKILPDIQRTARLVQEIAAASREQSAGAEQIAKAVDQFSQVTQQNSASAEEMSSGSEELSSQAEMLREIVSQFNTGKTIRQVARKSTQLHQFGSNGKINASNKVKSGSPIILDEFETSKSTYEQF